MRSVIREHLQFIVVVTLLTLVMTFPTIAYVFRTDVFWLPTGPGNDVYIKFWDIWYTQRILTGRADPFFTQLVFYPEGVSLAFHPFFYPHSITVNLLQAFMPLANAYSLTYLLIIWSSACSAYVYAHWLFKDKWIALFGAVVFGINAQTLATPTWPEIAWIAPIPLIMYCLHKGAREQGPRLFVLAGLLGGCTIFVTPYLYVVVLIMLALALTAFAAREWRNRRFWLHAALLVISFGLSSAWRLLPMIESQIVLEEATALGGSGEVITDVAAFFVNKGSPAYRTLLEALTQSPQLAGTTWHTYLGFVPLILIAIGLVSAKTRRRSAPWLALCCLFLVLSLGSALHVFGVEVKDLPLPKHYLNQLLPAVFQGFDKPSLFLSGARLPLALLACFGVLALRRRFAFAGRPAFIVALILAFALESYVPVPENIIDLNRVAYLNALAKEEDDEIGLINIPMGRTNSKRYLFYQSLSGYPQTQGAIRRTPESAFDYIRANPVLNAWQIHSHLSCAGNAAEYYRSAVQTLADDGFTHVVWHRHLGPSSAQAALREGFQDATPYYEDAFVSVYRLDDLLASCPT